MEKNTNWPDRFWLNSRRKRAISVYEEKRLREQENRNVRIFNVKQALKTFVAYAAVIGTILYVLDLHKILYNVVSYLLNQPPHENF